MKNYFLLTLFLRLNILGSYAQKDLTSLPSVKVFVNGSMNLICGWKPATGKFYSTDWHDDSKVKTNSWGYGCGLNISKRFARIFYISSGIEMSVNKYDKFRTSPYPSSPLLHDTAYYGYKLKTLDLPLILQLPLFLRRTHIFFCTGTVAEFTNSESYYATYTDHTQGYGSRFSKAIKSTVTRFTGAKLYAACNFEFKNTEGPILLLLGVNYLSPAIISKAKGAYFLKYGSVFLLRIGFGYSFCKKKRELIQLT